MGKLVNKLISRFYYLLFLSVPIVLYPFNSELFEFNKILLTYTFCVLICCLWVLKMIHQKRIIFKRTLVDFGILVFLASQILSTLLSIDTRTSLLGYYSRFHGGLASSITYSLLYWAFVSNMDRKKTMNTIYSMFISAFFVCTYAVLEHFGIDKNIWIQDVQNRVFSTLGQPNWLAAWIVSLMPITWGFALISHTSISDKVKNNFLGLVSKNKFWIWIFMSSLLFLTLIYTKSRSGFLGIASAFVVFWPSFYLLSRKKARKSFLQDNSKTFIFINLFMLVFVITSGTPWTPSVSELITKKPAQPQKVSDAEILPPALEVGGTRSTEIRKIVWRGALDIWKNYPIFGTGVETFAFSYYKFRPAEHNLVSEWDFLYNKAHNEYLNFLSTTGLVGTLAYLTLIGLIGSGIIKKAKTQPSKHKEAKIFAAVFMSSITSILVTNFFGFSVVMVAIMLFLIPAFYETLFNETDNESLNETELENSQKIFSSLVIVASAYLIFSIGKYWYADLQYSKGKMSYDAGNFTQSTNLLAQAAKLSPKEAIFRSDLARSTAMISLTLAENGNSEQALIFARNAISQSDKAVALSPANVNVKRDRASMFIKLATVDTSFLTHAKSTLQEAIVQAPTDAKLYFNLALTYIKTGDAEKAEEILLDTIEMKSNYKNARYALGVLFIDKGKTQLAKEQFEYILTKIDPNDEAVKRELNELN